MKHCNLSDIFRNLCVQILSKMSICSVPVFQTPFSCNLSFMFPLILVHGESAHSPQMYFDSVFNELHVLGDILPEYESKNI